MINRSINEKFLNSNRRRGRKIKRLRIEFKYSLKAQQASQPILFLVIPGLLLIKGEWLF